MNVVYVRNKNSAARKPTHPLAECADLQLNLFRINFSMGFQVWDLKVKDNHDVPRQQPDGHRGYSTGCRRRDLSVQSSLDPKEPAAPS